MFQFNFGVGVYQYAHNSTLAYSSLQHSDMCPTYLAYVSFPKSYHMHVQCTHMHKHAYTHAIHPTLHGCAYMVYMYYIIVCNSQNKSSKL